MSPSVFTTACAGLLSNAAVSLGAANCSAAWALACALRSSIFASPNTIYVSDAGLLKTSGFWMTNRICGRHRVQQEAGCTCFCHPQAIGFTVICYISKLILVLHKTKARIILKVNRTSHFCFF